MARSAARRKEVAIPTEGIGRGANVRPLLEEVVGDYKTPLYALLAATGCVLVIACLNVANLCSSCGLLAISGQSRNQNLLWV